MKSLRLLFMLCGLLIFGLHLLHAQNPYERLGVQSDPLTLSQGRYQEFFPNDTLVQIGPVIFNTITQKVVGFVEPDSSGLDFPADVASRWLSPDPLAHKFPEWSPYNYVLNNPLLLIDEDGRIPSYPQNHPVSKIVIAYSPNIWRGFWGANNTSLKHFHQWTRGNAGSDAYGKAIGAIGEGLFADRLTSSVKPLNGVPSNLSFGRSVGGLQTDLLQETQLFSRLESN